MGSGTVSRKVVPRVPLRHGEGDKDHLTSFGGLAALSLDALSSVAYGPEAIVLVLVAAGAPALRRVCRARAGGAPGCLSGGRTSRTAGTARTGW